jgi:SAM-dependent methyltransferase
VSDLHPATRGFADADRYERGRPDYPAAAVADIVTSLELGPGRRVVDLAAGTGKLTRVLVSSDADVVAIEPIPEMRRELERNVPGVVAMAGTAERLPLADESVDGVTVGQAFHWFRAEQALREIHRVLRPGGGLALVWNRRDERQPLQAALSQIINPLQGDAPRGGRRDWRAVLAESGLFERCERRLYDHVQVVDEQRLVERVLSISFVAAAPDDVRADAEARVRTLARRAERPIRLSYTTELNLGFRTS